MTARVLPELTPAQPAALSAARVRNRAEAVRRPVRDSRRPDGFRPSCTSVTWENEDRTGAGGHRTAHAERVSPLSDYFPLTDRTVPAKVMARRTA